MLQLVVYVWQNNMEINVKVESSGADAKISIDSSTTVGDVVEMLVRSPQMQQKFVYYLKFIDCLVIRFLSASAYLWVLLDWLKMDKGYGKLMLKW